MIRLSTLFVLAAATLPVAAQAADDKERLLDLLRLDRLGGGVELAEVGLHGCKGRG